MGLGGPDLCKNQTVDPGGLCAFLHKLRPPGGRLGIDFSEGFVVV